MNRFGENFKNIDFGPEISIFGIIRILLKRSTITFLRLLNANFVPKKKKKIWKNNEPILRKWRYRWTDGHADNGAELTGPPAEFSGNFLKCSYICNTNTI